MQWRPIWNSKCDHFTHSFSHCGLRRTWEKLAAARFYRRKPPAMVTGRGLVCGADGARCVGASAEGIAEACLPVLRLASIRLVLRKLCNPRAVGLGTSTGQSADGCRRAVEPAKVLSFLRSWMERWKENSRASKQGFTVSAEVKDSRRMMYAQVGSDPRPNWANLARLHRMADL
jgi:hypothetical protein